MHCPPCGLLCPRGHYVYYASRENTTITAMATFVNRILPRAEDEANPVAIRLLSGPQSRSSASTPLDARDSDRNHTIWNARLVLATTGLHLAQFRHKHRPLAKAVDYAELFIYDEAQQQAALSDVAILGALPRKCLLLRLGDPRQMPHLLQTLLIDDLPPRLEFAPPCDLQDTSLGSEGGLPAGGPPSGPLGQPVSEERSGIHHALMHVVTADDLRWHRAEGIDVVTASSARCLYTHGPQPVS